MAGNFGAFQASSNDFKVECEHGSETAIIFKIVFRLECFKRTKLKLINAAII